MREKEPELDDNEFHMPEIRRIDCTIRGTRPLLMSRYTGNKERVDMTPEEECREKLYLFENELVQPAEHLEKAMEKVSASMRLEGAGKKSYKDLFKAFVTVEPVFIKHKFQKWDIDTRAIRNPTTRGRNPRSRPMLPKWELSFTIAVKNSQIALEKIRQALTLAGEFNGIGDYRPKFGLFDVIKFEPRNSKVQS